ncbi:hypothetical protein L1987_50954 [Smallanthus sonchifolius]|uniref:Uncharacterized protein n=1 Tax=Smallanthus sonchifolius TaxID=185202 RepID=A0ACB9EPK7_9ASTR|nr:hypothetical protein L1987_50954 [Smallanthus sonchifolius]
MRCFHHQQSGHIAIYCPSKYQNVQYSPEIYGYIVMGMDEGNWNDIWMDFGIDTYGNEKWELMQCKDWEKRKWKKRRVYAIRDFSPFYGPANHVNSNLPRNKEPEEEECDVEKLDDTNNKYLEDFILVKE